MTEEIALQQQFGKQNPFSVPDGYFEELAAKVMAQLPEEGSTEMAQPARSGRRAVVHHMLRRYAVAASIVGVIVGAAVWFMQPRQNVAAQHFSATSVKAPVATVTEDNFEQMADYAMIDNQDIYSYLADY